MKRREFLTAAAAAAATALVGRSAIGSQTSTDVPKSPSGGPTHRPTIGIQLATHPLLHGDLGALLDDLQARAGVNALFPFIYGNTARWTGESPKNYRGGNYAIPHLQYYQGTGFTYEDLRAPEAGEVDLLERLTTAAKPRKIKTFAWLLEDIPQPLEKWRATYEVDAQGRRVPGYPSGRCYNHPLYRAFMLGLVEDYARSYPIDGVMWSSERQSGLLNCLGAWAHGEKADPGKLSACFCEHCEKRGRESGIDVARAKKGFAELEKFVRAGRAQQRPTDGYFVAFYRLLLTYPELLAWENLWVQSRFDFMTAIRQRVKTVNPALQVGWHLWHNISFSPFHRAEMDYARIAQFSDFVKPVLYANCAGERVKSFVDSVGENVFGDLPRPEALQMLYAMFGYHEAPYDTVMTKGFSADYVRRETRRTVDDMAGSGVEVWPGLDVDVPVPEGASPCTAEAVKDSVLASFAGGATGVILSRNHAEMKPEHLAGAGAALRELKLL
jgi:hypothetical protein